MNDQKYLCVPIYSILICLFNFFKESYITVKKNLKADFLKLILLNKESLIFIKYYGKNSNDLFPFKNRLYENYHTFQNNLKKIDIHFIVPDIVRILIFLTKDIQLSRLTLLFSYKFPCTFPYVNRKFHW